MSDRHHTQAAPPAYSALFETPGSITARYSPKTLSQLDLIPYLPDHIRTPVRNNEYRASVGSSDITKLLSTAKAYTERSEMTLRGNNEDPQEHTRRVEYDALESSDLLRRCIVKYFAKPDGSIQLIDLRWHYVLRLEDQE